MKETMRKERGERQDLKRRHDDILSKFEKLKDINLSQLSRD